MAFVGVLCGGTDWDEIVEIAESSEDLLSEYLGSSLVGVPSSIPFPELISFTAASVNDLTAFKHYCGESIYDRSMYGDRIFLDEEYFSQKERTNNYCVLTSKKLVKGEPELTRHMEKAYNDLYSKAVSAIRQPIESFFNWLIQKTAIQNASKVRDSKGLLLHLFGKIAIAFITRIFNP